VSLSPLSLPASPPPRLSVSLSQSVRVCVAHNQAHAERERARRSRPLRGLGQRSGTRRGGDRPRSSRRSLPASLIAGACAGFGLLLRVPTFLQAPTHRKHRHEIAILGVLPKHLNA
jgi:hypothetical protein